MSLHRIISVALALAVVSSTASAQVAPGGGEPPCIKDFIPLRQEAERRANAVRSAGEKRAPREEVCSLIVRFAEAENKLVKYAEENAVWCGIPGEALTQMKASQKQTQVARQRVCSAAGPAPQPRKPSLSEALSGGAALPTPQTSKTGRGTFDTLTGNALAR
jgi:hypothetical protein